MTRLFGGSQKLLLAPDCLVERLHSIATRARGVVRFVHFLWLNHVEYFEERHLPGVS